METGRQQTMGLQQCRACYRKNQEMQNTQKYKSKLCIVQHTGKVVKCIQAENMHQQFIYKRLSSPDFLFKIRPHPMLRTLNPLNGKAMWDNKSVV